MKEQSKDNFFSNYKHTITDYLDSRLLLLQLKIVKKISSVIGQMICIAIMMGLCFLIFLFVSVMLGFLLSKWFDNYFAGFGTVTAIFLATLLILIVKRKSVADRLIGSIIIDILLDKHEKEDAIAERH